MKRNRFLKFISFASMLLGTCLLALTHMLKLPIFNWILIVLLSTIFFGLLLYVWTCKHDSKY